MRLMALKTDVSWLCQRTRHSISTQWVLNHDLWRTKFSNRFNFWPLSQDYQLKW